MNEIILELSALFIALFCLMDCLKKRKRLYLPIPSGWDNKLRDQHFTYMVLLVTLMISAVTSCLEVLLENYFNLSGPFILNLLNEIYFVFHQFISFVFTLYIINMTNVGKEKSRSFFALFLTPFFLLLTPCFHASTSSTLAYPSP